MGFKNLSKIKPKHKAKLLIGPQNILEQIELNFGKVADRNALKLIPSFVEFVGCLIEEAYTSHSNVDKKKINKKEELLKAIADFTKTNLTEQEKKQLSEIIEDLHTSGRFKKFSYLSQIFFQLLKPLLKKLL